jgi:acyl dehydratase
VHGEHDIVIRRPLVVGEPLHTYVEGHGARPAGRNSAVTLRYVTVDARDEVVAEQWWTTIYLGTNCDPVGAPAPDHGFPDAVRELPIGTVALDVDEGMAHRYAAVTGDWSAHHFELDAARRSGVDRVFLHGLCTMGLCARAVVALAADGDPGRIRRLAVRFASPTFLGERLDVHGFDAGPGVVAFEADCADARVITQGRAELR